MAAGPAAQVPAAAAAGTAADDAVLALVHAGFKRRQAEDAVAKALAAHGDGAPEADRLVRDALAILVGRGAPR